MTEAQRRFESNLPVPYMQRPELITPGGAGIFYRPDLWKTSSKYALTTGVCLLAAIRAFLRETGQPTRLHKGIRVLVTHADGFQEEVERERWGTFLIRHGMTLDVYPPIRGGGGGKNPLATILSVVVVVVAAIATWYVGGAGGLALTPTLGLGAAAGYAAGAVVMIGGMMLVSAVCPPSTPKLSQAKATNAEKVWSIDGVQNRADLYGLVPWVLGRVRFAPRYASRGYTYLNGNNQVGRYLFCVAGHNKVEGLRIGDTDLSAFKGVSYKVHESWQGEELQFFKQAIYQEDMSVKLTNAAGWQQRTTTLNTEEIQIELYLARGIGRIDNEGGRRKSLQLDFEVQFKKSSDTSWESAFGIHPINAGTVALTYSPKLGDTKIYIDDSGNVNLSGGQHIATAVPFGALRVDVYLQPGANVGYSVDKFTIHFSAGSYSPYISISGSTVTPQRRGYSFKMPEPGQYDFRIRRATQDYDANNTDWTYLADSDWVILRSLQQGAALVYQNAPLTVIELEIQATDQLNGAVSEFNAIFTSYAPVWDGERWVDAPTNNPASLGLLFALSPHVRYPVPSDVWDTIDENAWRGFYEWCNKYEWAYNAVQTAEESVREVLHSVLASARAVHTFKNGLYSVSYDHEDKIASYPFGPRNSWGFKASKTFIKEQPHALRVQFLNEERDFQEDERIVYADGYTAENTTNIVSAEFDGVTNPDLIYRHARLRLADSIWRPETYEMTTDYAFLNVAVGDRVPVTHDVPMWGIRQARIAYNGLIYAEYAFDDMNKAALVSLAFERQGLFEAKRLIPAGMSVQAYSDYLNAFTADDLRDVLEGLGVRDTSRVAGVKIDDMVTMELGKSYGLIVYASKYNRSSFSIQAVDGTTNTLMFLTPVPAADAPYETALVSFGEAGRETHDCIVTAIVPADNLTATVFMQDYSVDQIYAALTGPIPPWDSDISMPSRWQLGKPAAPVITSIATDEWVLQQLADGTLIPRIQVSFFVPEREGVTAQSVRIQVREKSDMPGDWIDNGSARADTGFVYATGVEEKIEYEIRLYSVSDLGVSSDFSPAYSAVVIGRTTPPPAPTRVNIDGTRIWWEMPFLPPDVRGYAVYMGFDAEDAFEYALRLTNPITPVMEFDIARWAGWSRRIYIQTVDDIGLTSAPVSIVINLGDVQQDNIVYAVSENAGRNWPGVVTNGHLNEDRHLVPDATQGFWKRPFHWNAPYYWGTSATQSLEYVSSFILPEQARQSWLSLDVLMPYGVLASVEYRFAASGPFWNRDLFWSAPRFWGVEEISEWQPMPSRLWIGEEKAIQIRARTKAGTLGIIEDIHWIFDVEDETDRADNLDVPSPGIRVPLNKTFRWIENITFGLEYHEGGEAMRVVWLDKGIVSDGQVVAGPFIQCQNINGAPVPGVVDVIMQGAKGVQ